MSEAVGSYIDLARERLAAYAPRIAERSVGTPAAVLALLYHHDGADRLLFTRRTETLSSHKGQIAFPGGRADVTDADLAATALRETWEEIGIAPADVTIFGRLDDVITNSGYRVAPFVGRLERVPYPFVPSPTEVAAILEVPVAHLLDPATLKPESREVGGQIAWMPAYWWEGQRIWGATARMVQEFIALLRGDADALESVRKRHDA